jgi:hypothetical protein
VSNETAVELQLRELPLKAFLDFLRVGDTEIHHYGWKNVLKELLRRLGAWK